MKAGAQPVSHIVVVISVDWEGRSLLPENLQHMAAFRRKHPDVPMQHFLNAAYYTRPGIDADDTTRAIHEVLAPDDDHGLHIHAWQSLLEAAGAEASDIYGFLRDDGRVARAADDWGFYPAEAGYDIPIEDLGVDSLEKIIETSRRILVEQRFRNPVAFRAGAWVSGRKVQQSLAKTGFVLDCSAVDVDPVVRRFGNIPLCERLRGLWPAINHTSQPFLTTTPAGPLWQVPNNASLVDYLTAEEVVEIFESNAACWERVPQRNWFVSTGFHQETARVFLSRLDQAIVAMKRLARQRQWPLIFTARPQDFVDKEQAAV
jgi:hypothetical protein